ncbi:hypothetical protein BJF85_17825 [Saccharomonospora sp. CUA-673]|nr:hypothetical protein BJF85_17825 [Saccharomonospora sp. CUA-673]
MSLVAGLLAVLGIFVLFRSMLAMTNLFVTHAGELDPLSRAISYYVFVEHAVETFNATLIAVSVATATILLGMAQLRVRLGVPALSWFAVWCVGLVLCVVFPVDNSPYVETVSGWIHQFAGGSLFISFPLAGYALAKRLGTQPDWARTGRVVRKFAVTTTVIALTYLAMRLPDMLHWWEFPAALDWRALGGLAQRSMFAVALVMLLVLAVQLLRVAWRHRRAAVPAERVGQTP